ncbi:MAG: hypothetical protein J2P31_14385, partial [Blastocatellia bacterium]|nr:hypothetical protein [Blastocatellia bacterium]
MSTSTRLAIFLVVTTGAVYVVAGFFTLRQRESALRSTIQSGLQAYADTIKVALEDHYELQRDETDVGKFVSRLNKNIYLFNVVLYDDHGRTLISSNPQFNEQLSSDREFVNKALQTGETVERLRRIDGQEFFSLIMPVQMGGAGRGAFEIM